MRLRHFLSGVGAALCTLATAAPPDAPSVETLKDLIRLGRYADAAARGEELLARLDAQGSADPGARLDVLDLTTEALWRGGRAPDATALARTAQELARESKLPPGDARAVRADATLGRVLLRGGNLKDARPLIEEALARREAAGQSPEVADSLTDLGLLLFQSGERDASRALHERALALREKTLGPQHPDVADSLVHLALSCLTAGDYARARSLQERSLAIREAALGPDHPLIAINLEHLGKIAYDLGEWEQARSFWERGLAIRLETLGPNHPQIGNSLTNLGSLLSDLADYSAARSSFERAIEIKTQAFGGDHVQVASTVNNLATLLNRIGDPDAALALHRRALGIYEKALGPDHLTVGQVVNNIALIAFEQEKYPDARAHYERSLRILDAAHPEGHPDVALVLRNLGLVLTMQKDYDAAEQRYARALAMSRKILGERHSGVGHLLDGQAILEAGRGNLPAAQDLYRRSLGIFEEALGPDHPETASERVRLARAELVLGETTRALDDALMSERALLAHFQRTARGLAEREALAFESDRFAGIGVALSVLAKGSAAAPSVAAVFDAIVRSRAAVLDEMASRKRAWLESGDPAIDALGDELTAARNRLARLVTGGGADPAAMARAVEERDKAERRLAERSALFREGMARTRIGLAEAQAGLPRRAALVSFIQFERQEPAKDRQGPAPVPVTSYAALVVPADRGALRFVVLGPAEGIDRAILAWREQAAVQPAGPAVTGSAAETRYRDAARRLREVLWDPIAPALAGAERAFLVPDGDINLVDFGTLPDGDGYLIESGPILHYLSAERDLAAGPAPRRSGSGILALGGADFEMTGDISAAAARRETVARAGYRAASGCENLDAIRFDPLPGTAEEVTAIGTLWSGARDKAETIEILTGPRANEAALKKAGPGRRVLHIATHSFFLHDVCPSLLQSALAERPAAGERRSLLGRNPLLLTGLALAGANDRSSRDATRSAGARPAREEDGLLTAEEIGAIDLSGVEWAVLSACETGVGRIQAGEGVLGLRRSFQIAGVRSLIMSLWKVQDDAARQWMTALYKARFAGKSTSDAARQAGLDRLHALRERGRGTHPFFWGGFVAVGDWR